MSRNVEDSLPSVQRDPQDRYRVPDDAVPAVARERLGTLTVNEAVKLSEKLKMPVTATRIRQGMYYPKDGEDEPELPTFLVGNRVRIAPYDLYQFLAGMRRTTPGKPRGRAVAS